MRKLFLLLLLVSLSFTVQAKLPSYADYLEMDLAKREKVATKLVRKKGKYLSMKLPHYDLKSDVDKEYTLKMAVFMEDFYTRFASVFKGKRKNRVKPEVYVLGDKPSYAQALGEYSNGRIKAGWTAGMFAYRSDGKAALFGYRRGNEDAKLLKTMLHEGTHQLLNSFVGSKIPVWFNEGTATNFETWQMYRSKIHNVNSALALSNRALGVVHYKKSGEYVKFSDLVAIDLKKWISASDPGPNYVSAWVALNFFLTTDRGREIFSRLYKALRNENRKGPLLNQKFIAEAEKRIEAYIENTVTPHVRYTRHIRKALVGGEREKALAIAQKMQSEHSENDEALFYTTWLGATAETALGNLKKLESMYKKELANPDIMWACAEVAKLGGKKHMVNKYRKLLKKHDSQHSALQHL